MFGFIFSMCNSTSWSDIIISSENITIISLHIWINAYVKNIKRKIMETDLNFPCDEGISALSFSQAMDQAETLIFHAWICIILHTQV